MKDLRDHVPMTVEEPEDAETFEAVEDGYIESEAAHE